MRLLLIKMMDESVLYLPWPKELPDIDKGEPGDEIWNYLETNYPKWREWKAEDDDT